MVPSKRAIEELELEAFSKIDLTRDMFVFSAYTGGPRVSDVLMLERKAFSNSHVLINIKKTGGQVSVKLPKKTMEIFSKWKEHSTRFVFPCFEDNIDMVDMRILDTAISRETSSINKHLKQVTKKINSKKNLSFHISRHTWATKALRKGVFIDKVSKLMAHSQIKETQIYTKIVNEELDKAMEVFNE